MGNKDGGDRQGLVPLERSFARIYAAKQWSTPWRLYLLHREWPAIVGAEVARLTSPAFFRQEVLWMYVQDSAWMHHLQFIKLDLLTRVNQVLAEHPVTDIRWQLQPFLPDPPPRRLLEPREVDPVQAEEFAELSTTVDNAECRAALQRLWRIFAAHDQEQKSLPD